MKKILLIRTFRFVGTGGPVVPLEILYLASAINKNFKNNARLKIIDLGVDELSFEGVKGQLSQFKPEVIILNSLIWEADIAHKLASLAKSLNKKVIVIAEGQLPTLAKDYMLQDENIDYLIVGEPDLTGVELLSALESNKDLSKVKGIIYRNSYGIVKTNPRQYIKSLDDFDINSFAWDLIEIKKYARYSNWNGSLKEKFYLPILTSRGCPFDCTFCCNKKVIGKKFRARSPQSVISEIKFLNKKYSVKEIHIYDPVFNYDIERAKEICKLIINSGLKISLAFPHGLRADIMTEELVDLLKEAGTYKIVYGIETGSACLQKKIKKNLNLNQVANIIEYSADKGIIVGGYFMLGFPTESIGEMQETINFAVNSKLDLAAFFKVTLYNDIIKLYKSNFSQGGIAEESIYNFQDLGYYSQKRSHAGISASDLNSMILIAQQKFYLNWQRIKRSFWKAPNKFIFLGNIIKALVLLLQGYLIKELSKK